MDVRQISGVPQVSVLGPLSLLLYNSDTPMILEKIFVGFADHSTFLVLVPKPRNKDYCIISKS